MIRVKDLGIRRVFDEYPPRLLTGYGVVRVNPRAWRQLRRWVGGDVIANHAKARPDLLAWLRPWGGMWLYRVATDAYVDYPPSRVIEAVRRLLPNAEPVKLGSLFGKPEYVEYGAKYAESVLGYEASDGVVKGIWVRAGDDGYTAIRIRPFLGFKREISAVILPNRVSRRLHVERESRIEERLRVDIDASVATLRAFDISELVKYSIPFTVVNNIARRVRSFTHHWRVARALIGSDNAYALAIALGRALVSSSGESRERIARLLEQLTSDPMRFVRAYSEASSVPTQED
ncbi:hypothetical protein [Vulcanisaeta souniana]|nr:hypothetical protein [Vulcanisaeta souniana]